ncbi:hypothetical protein WA158_000420 [Blastocystis sp. Blastoise]
MSLSRAELEEDSPLNSSLSVTASDKLNLKFRDGKYIEIKKNLLDKYPDCALNSYCEDIDLYLSQKFFQIDVDFNKFNLVISYMNDSLSFSSLSEDDALLLYRSLKFYNINTQKLVDCKFKCVSLEQLFAYCDDTGDELYSCELDPEDNRYFNYKHITRDNPIDTSLCYIYHMKECMFLGRFDEISKLFERLTFLKVEVIHYSLQFQTVQDYDLVFSTKIPNLFPYLKYSEIFFTNYSPQDSPLERIKVAFSEHNSTHRWKKGSSFMRTFHYPLIRQVDICKVNSSTLSEYLLNNPFANEVQEVMIKEDPKDTSQLLLLLSAFTNNLYPNIKYIHLKCCSLGDSHIELCTALKENDLNDLVCLDLSKNAFQSSAFLSVIEILMTKDLSELEELNLSSMQLYDDSITALSDLLKNNKTISLRRLYLQDNLMTIEGLLTLCNVMELGKLQKLEVLNIMSNRIKDTDMQVFFKILKHKCLPSITALLFAQNADDCSAQFSLICSLVQAKCFNKVKVLNLTKYNVDKDKLIEMVEATDNKTLHSLQTLNFSKISLNEPLVLSICVSLNEGNMPYLEELNFESCNLHDTCFGYLCQIIEAKRLPFLKRLYLGNNMFTSKSLLCFLSLIVNKYLVKLTTLSLKYIYLGDSLGINLFQVIESDSLPNLRILDLQGCQLTDGSLNAFCNVTLQRKCKMLSKVNLSHIGLSFPCRKSLFELLSNSDMECEEQEDLFSL